MRSSKLLVLFGLCWVAPLSARPVDVGHESGCPYARAAGGATMASQTQIPEGSVLDVASHSASFLP